MRTSLLRLGAVALLACGTLSAQVQMNNTTRSSITDVPNVGKAITERPATVRADKSATPMTQALTYSALWRSDFYPFFETFTASKVFLYEPGTDAIFIVRNNRTFDQTSGQLTGGQVRVYSSTDNGANWGEAEIYNQLGTVFAMPNMAIVNPGGSATSVADLQWTVYGLTYDETANWARTSQSGIFKTSGDPFSFPMEGPEQNNNQGFTWNEGDMLGVSGDNPAVYFAGMLGNSGGGQYGTYGMWGFDFAAEDFTASTIPAQWTATQFRNPNNVNSTFNSQMRMGADSDGKLYTCVNNLFADDENNRVPAFSTSEDQGATWTNFSRMPMSAFDAYKTQHGWDNIQIYRPYDMEALVVTGSNEFSYFFRVARVAENQVANLDIVEAKYKSGTWTLNRVAELNGFPLIFRRQDSISDLSGQYAWIPQYDINSLGHEIEAAITADGEDILVKWIDENPALGYQQLGKTQSAWFFSQTTNTWNETQFDSMLTTDVYYAHRKVTSSSWTPATNLTNDHSYDHGTRIPPVIPSLTSVPFLSLKTIAKNEYNAQYPYLPAIQQLPDLILDASADYRTPNTVQYASFNATLTSVNESETYNFRFNTVSPNPASNEAEVAFTTEVGSKVMVDVYSTNGSRIATVFNGMLDAGIHALTIDASTYASGTYYVALTVGGQRLTQPLVIVK